MCPKRGRKVIFEVFLTFLEAQNLSKFLGHVRAFIFFHEKSKNSIHFAKLLSNSMRSAGGVAHQMKIHVLQNLMRSATNLMHIALFQTNFGGLPGVHIGHGIAHWRYY